MTPLDDLPPDVIASVAYIMRAVRKCGKVFPMNTPSRMAAMGWLVSHKQIRTHKPMKRFDVVHLYIEKERK